MFAYMVSGATLSKVEYSTKFAPRYLCLLIIPYSLLCMHLVDFSEDNTVISKTESVDEEDCLRGATSEFRKKLDLVNKDPICIGR